jgi:hypothetical protein
VEELLAFKVGVVIVPERWNKAAGSGLAEGLEELLERAGLMVRGWGFVEGHLKRQRASLVVPP